MRRNNNKEIADQWHLDQEDLELKFKTIKELSHKTLNKLSLIQMTKKLKMKVKMEKKVKVKHKQTMVKIKMMDKKKTMQLRRGWS